jgi:uncharacterized membrane protein (UPF0127 family)
MLGLRGRDGLAPRHGLLLRTRSVHTLGMRFAIIAVLLDEDGTVRRVKRLPPGRVLLPRRKVRYVLECGEDATFRPGDVVRLS